MTQCFPWIAMCTATRWQDCGRNANWKNWHSEKVGERKKLVMHDMSNSGTFPTSCHYGNISTKKNQNRRFSWIRKINRMFLSTAQGFDTVIGVRTSWEALIRYAVCAQILRPLQKNHVSSRKTGCKTPNGLDAAGTSSCRLHFLRVFCFFVRR